MFVKRFVAKDMQEAIRKIGAEFGPDAVILQSKSIRKKGVSGLFAKKMVEVIAAYEPNRNKKAEKPAVKRTPKKQPVSKPKSQADSLKKTADLAAAEERKDEKVDLLSLQMKELKDTVADFSNKMRLADREATLSFSPDVLSLYNGLLDKDVQEDLSKEIASQTQGIHTKKGIETGEIAKQLILDRLGETPPIKIKKFKQNVFIFAGPTGAGKTTTLAKLAGMMKFEEKLEVGIINTDTYRVGAMEQVRIYAEIMDIPLHTAYSPEELDNALKALEDKDVVLIDTAGRNSKDKSGKNELAMLIEAASPDEVFLVLSVSTGYKVCMDIINNYSFINDYKLIITKLDEVDGWGNVLNIADYSKKSLAYLTIGQNVPSDIRKADAEKLAGGIAGSEVAQL